MKVKITIHLKNFLRETSGFQKIGFNNFIDGATFDLIEFESQPLRNFEANIDLVAEFISNSSPLMGEGQGRGATE